MSPQSVGKSSFCVSQLCFALNQIQGALLSMPGAAAFFANAGNDQSMAGHSERMLSTDRFAELLKFAALKLDQLITHRAMQMVMLRIAIIVLINGPATEIHATQQAGVDQFVERSINGRSAHLRALGLGSEVDNQLFRVEMVVALKNVIDKNPPLLGDSFAFALQKLRKPLLRRARDFDRTK